MSDDVGLTEIQRWQLILDCEAMLLKICKRTLAKANCTTLTPSELLSELMPMCLHWLERYDAALGSPRDYLAVSVRLKARTIIAEHIRSNGRNVPIDSISEAQHPSYAQSTTGQEQGESVLRAIDKLPAGQAYIVRQHLEGKPLRDIAAQMGVPWQTMLDNWLRAKQTLAMVLSDQQHRSNTS